jgi:hypothetical protein
MPVPRFFGLKQTKYQGKPMPLHCEIELRVKFSRIRREIHAGRQQPVVSNRLRAMLPTTGYDPLTFSQLSTFNSQLFW